MVYRRIARAVLAVFILLAAAGRKTLGEFDYVALTALAVFLIAWIASPAPRVPIVRPSSSHCALCGLVQKVCPRGPQPEYAWKRPMLFLAGAVIAAVSLWVAIVVASYTPDAPNAVVLYALLGLLALVGFFGVVVSIWACKACVARTFTVWNNL